MTIEIIVGIVVLAVVAYIVYQSFTLNEPTEPTLVADKVQAEKAAPKKTTKKTATKKAAKVDLGSMSKNDLLAHAKKNGIKANASMKKADILAAIKG